MEPTNQPSPYFIRRTVQTEPKAIDIAAFTAVEEPVHPLYEYWVTIKRHRWLILISALAVLLFAFFYSVTRVPLYTAEATVLIERKAPQSLKVQDARDSMDYDYNNEFYKTQYEILQSPALAERVIREEALQNHPLFGAKGGANKPDGAIEGLANSVKGWAKDYLPATPAAVAPSPTMRLAGDYLAKLEIRPVAGTSLVKIKFTTPDPALSARLANAHANSYLRYGVDLRVQSNDEASEFLKQRLTKFKERVEQSETALNSYRKNKGIIAVDEKENVIIDRWLDLTKNLNKAEAERIGLEAQIRSIHGGNFDEIPAVQ